MDGAGFKRSTINQDHRLVGVDTRSTLLPLPRCANGYPTDINGESLNILNIFLFVIISE